MNKRIIFSLLFFVVGLLIWVPSSDIVKLIIANEEILLGRYSRSQFAISFVLTVMLWIAAAIIACARDRPLSERIFALLMIYISSGLSVFVLVVASGFLAQPRYIEQEVRGVDADTGIPLAGIIRHRPPNERYDLLQKDVPEQLRSYPDAPAGYPEFSLVLTSDTRGFRNQEACNPCDIEIIGDSFVAGSQVSDDQVWTELVRKRIDKSLYNLGVAGTDPLEYLNNFVILGRDLKPKRVIVTIYEGNDFRNAPSLPLPSAKPEAISRKQASYRMSVSEMAKASPVTAGLRRFATEVLAKINHDKPVPSYKEKVGFMPLALPVPHGMQYYSFDPKRLIYLNVTEKEFVESSDWLNVRAVLDKFVMLSKKDGFSLTFVYAPSTPHVVMPLLKDSIPADQLLRFMRYKNKKIKTDNAEALKQQVFANLDSTENVMLAWCEQNKIDCISTTDALRKATAEGEQTYYSYDQHWTPKGNVVVAGVVGDYLMQKE